MMNTCLNYQTSIPQNSIASNLQCYYRTRYVNCPQFCFSFFFSFRLNIHISGNLLALPAIFRKLNDYALHIYMPIIVSCLYNINELDLFYPSFAVFVIFFFTLFIDVSNDEIIYENLIRFVSHAHIRIRARSSALTYSHTHMLLHVQRIVSSSRTCVRLQ